MRSFKFLTHKVLELDSALLLDKTGKAVGVNNWQQADMLAAYEKVDRAGIVVLSRNLFEVYSNKIAGAEVEMTFFAGKPVH